MERRAVQRVKLSSPALATLGAQRVFIANLSTRGAALLHASPLATQRSYVLEATVAGVAVSVECELLRCRLVGRAKDGTSLYQSGVVFRGDAHSVRSAVATLVAAELEQARRARSAALRANTAATQL